MPQLTTAAGHRSGTARVWLAAGFGGPPAPTGSDRPVVSDLTRVWIPAQDGEYRTVDGHHHASWAQLHARYDLIEIVGRDGNEPTAPAQIEQQR